VRESGVLEVARKKKAAAGEMITWAMMMPFVLLALTISPVLHSTTGQGLAAVSLHLLIFSSLVKTNAVGLFDIMASLNHCRVPEVDIVREVELLTQCHTDDANQLLLHQD